MKWVNAYSFGSPMTLREIFARLNELGPWRWYEGESDSFGDYISTMALPAPDRASIKIMNDTDGYIVDFVLEAEPDVVGSVYDTLFTHLLPAVRATKLTETEHSE